jgi:flavin reductase (DIM6/NTAB) family NADH-FMN oxidoreductase RutF
MSLKGNIHQRLRRVLLGPKVFPQVVDLSLQSPQTEIVVWLHGLGAPRDVTSQHSIACAAPFAFCIGLGHEDISTARANTLSLRFCEATGDRNLLGEIGLKLWSILSLQGQQLYLFKATSCRNFCIPRTRLWAHYLFNTYGDWKNRKKSDVRVSSLDSRCNAVAFICPRPVAFLSAVHDEGMNIFPINLFGTVGDAHLAFALNSKRQGPFISQLQHLALNSIPSTHTAVVRTLGKNHRRQSIDLQTLPFSFRSSKTFHIPVPDFAPRTRELQIEYVQPGGSHTFFLARVVSDEDHTELPEFHMIHGLYAARRYSDLLATQKTNPDSPLRPPSFASNSHAQPDANPPE